MNVLERIFAQKKTDLAKNLAAWPIVEVKAAAIDQPTPKGFRKALEKSAHAVALIAEVKKASPVKGVLCHDFDPVRIALQYKDAGADCLSVLTDVEFFQGHPDYLLQCRSATGLPTLRKDFIVDEYEVWVSRAIGADAVLLIADYLETAQLKKFRALAESLGMDSLVEVHSVSAAEKAMEAGATMIGVNNRDLTTFDVDLSTTATIAPYVAGGSLLVSESALKSREDVAVVQAAGARAVLIGSAFVSSPDVGSKVKEVMGW